MIRFGGRTTDGKAIIGLALGPENLRRLAAGQPIVVDGETVGALGVAVLLVYGDTELAGLEALQAAHRESGGSVESLDEAIAALRRRQN